jgi:DegV family protein with EDD domain
MPIRIVTDSTCDLPPETIKAYGIGVVPLYINIGNQGYLDGIDISREEFYTNLPNYPEHPTTAVPSLQKFHAIYNALAEEGASEILSIHVSKELSAILDVAQSAAHETKTALVKVFDSRQLSLGTGFLVETAARMASAGSSIQDILAAINDQIKRSYVFAALDTLEFLKRSGRMNSFMSSLGSLLQIKPILTMYDGKPDSEKVRTRGRAMQRLVEMLEAVGRLERIAIVHTHALEERVAELREQAASLLPRGNLLEVDITPVIGAHLGPGTVGFAAVAAKN